MEVENTKENEEPIILDGLAVKKASRNFVGLLSVHTCKEVTSLFVSIFLIAQVFMLTNHNFVAVGLFLLTEFSVRFVVNISASVLCKRINPVHFIRLSSLLVCGFLVMLMFWDGALEHHYILMGAIWGATSTLYWAGAAVIIMQSMSKEQMYPFKAWRTSLIAAVRLLFPITLGLVLDFGNLFIATTIIAVICIVMLATSFMIKSEFTPQKFGLFMGKYLKTAREHNYLKPIIHNFFVMMLKGMGEFVVIGVTLLIVLVLGTNVGIGAFGTVFAASSILLIIVYARIKKTAHKKFILLASGVLLLSVSFVFIIEISLLTLIIFNSVYMTVKRAVYAEYQTEKAKLPQYWARGKEFVIETKILQSIGLFIGRVIAFISIILVGLFGTTYVAFAWVIFGMMLALVAHTFLLYAFKKKYGCGYGTNVQSEAVTHLESGVT